MTTIIPVAAWCPDLPDLAEATSIALNVIPITPESYGPMPSLASYSSDGLDSQCIGAICVQATDLNVLIFAGSADKLYELTVNSAAWQDVSGATYGTAEGGNWQFVLYQNSVIATNFSDPMQSFALESSTTFENLFTAPAWAPSTAYSTAGQMVLANGNRYSLLIAGTSASSGTGPTGTGAGIQDGPTAPAWGTSTTYSTVGQQVVANGNIYALATAGTSAGSGTGPSGTGSGIVDGTCTWNYVAAQGAVWNYQSGAPPQARRICTPKNFVMVGNTSDPVGGLGPQRAWWSASGDGTTWPAPGSDAAIQNMSDYNDFEGNFGEITGMVDSLANADVAIFFRHAVWRGLFVGPPDVFDFFPTENVRGCPAPNSIVPLGAVVWYLGEDGFYAFDGAQSSPIGADKFDNWFFANVNMAHLEMVIGAANVPNKAVMWAFPSVQAIDGVCDSILVYRWDIQRASYVFVGPDGIEWLMRVLTFSQTMDSMDAFGFTDVDTLPASLDSPIWVGGALRLGAINGSHEMAFFTGPNMAAQVATQTKQLTQGRRSFVQSARPLVDLTNGTPTVAFAARTNLYDAETFGPAVLPDISGECPQRSDGRYHNAAVAMPAGALWTHIVGVDVTFTAAGLR